MSNHRLSGCLVGAAFLLLGYSFISNELIIPSDGAVSSIKNIGIFNVCFHQLKYPDKEFNEVWLGCHSFFGNDGIDVQKTLWPSWLEAVIIMYITSLVLIVLTALTIVLDIYFSTKLLVISGVIFTLSIISGSMILISSYILNRHYREVGWVPNAPSHKFTNIFVLILLSGLLMLHNGSLFLREVIKN